MASAAERERMVQRQIAARGIEDPAILHAFRAVPREPFVPEDQRTFAYDDGALPIEAGQTISQPYIVALMIEAARIGTGSTVLEVGAGSGFAERTSAMTDNAADQSLADLITSRAVALPAPDSPEFAVFDRYADKRVVMLGEGSHGTHEFYAARAAITRRFVERHGFTVIAVEADWLDAASYNRYIAGEPAPDASQPAFQRFPTWMWRNTVIRDLLHDLRALNDEQPKEKKAGFYSLDI